MLTLGWWAFLAFFVVFALCGELTFRRRKQLEPVYLLKPFGREYLTAAGIDNGTSTAKTPIYVVKDPTSEWLATNRVGPKGVERPMLSERATQYLAAKNAVSAPELTAETLESEPAQLSE
jgi:hypothetical protein